MLCPPTTCDPARPRCPNVALTLTRVLLVGWLCVSLVGCARWNVPSQLPWTKDTRPTVPEQIVPMWTDTVLYEPGKPGVRGFGARVYFYGHDSQEPIKVDGSLVVYAFDATDVSQMPTPEKKFVFPAERFAEHHSKTRLGHSYSVWIPWDEVGGPTRQLSLVTRFEGSQGEIVVSDPVRKLLPGLSRETPDGQTPDGQAEAASANLPASYDAQPREQTSPTTVTIEVPPSFSRKLHGEARDAARKTSNERNAGEFGDDQGVAEAAGLWLGSREASSGEQPVAETARLWPNYDQRNSGEPGDGGTSGDVNPPEVAEAGRLTYHSRLAAHFARATRPARDRSALRQAADPVRRQPYPATWLSGLPPTPRSTATAPKAAD